MTDVNNLKFKGNVVESVTFKGNTVNALNYGDLHWTPQPEPPTPTEFTLSPVLMSSRMGDGIYRQYSGYMSVTGNALWYMKASGADLGKVTITQDRYNVKAQRIGNWGYIMSRLYQNDGWPGGIGGSDWMQQMSFTSGSTTLNGTFRSDIDEDNTTLLSGCYVNKVFRIPSIQYSGYTKYYFYPYTFNSNMYGETKMNVQYYDIATNAIYDIDDSFDFSNTIFQSISSSIDGITGTLNYTIKANTTNNYREGAIIVNETLIHFLQEPASNNRIFFGKADNDMYLDNDNWSQHNEEYLFHQLGSYDLDGDFELTFTEMYQMVLYPQDLTDRYNIVVENGELSGSSTVTWVDGTVFLWKGTGATTNIKIKFIKL